MKKREWRRRRWNSQNWKTLLLLIYLRQGYFLFLFLNVPLLIIIHRPFFIQCSSCGLLSATLFESYQPSIHIFSTYWIFFIFHALLLSLMLFSYHHTRTLTQIWKPLLVVKCIFNIRTFHSNWLYMYIFFGSTTSCCWHIQNFIFRGEKENVKW